MTADSIPHALIPGGGWIAVDTDFAEAPVVCWALTQTGEVEPMIWDPDTESVIYAFDAASRVARVYHPDAT